MAVEATERRDAAPAAGTDVVDVRLDGVRKHYGEVAAAIDSGTVWVNTWLLRDLRVPFGGMKESGLGREGGFDSLDFFTEAKNVCIKL